MHGQVAASKHSWAQWQVQAHAARHVLGAAKGFKPWTGCGFEFKNLRPTDRAGEILDLAVMQYLGSAASTASLLRDGPEALRAGCQELFTDISQNPGRKPHTGQDHVSRCLTASSSVYSHGSDRMVLPIELLLWQGHQVDVKVPRGMKQRELRDLAGEGITLPCLASLIFSLHLSGSLKTAMQQ